MENKVLVVGLDGATWDLIKPWADDGRLPTFQKLMAEGTYGTLRSTTPPITIPAVPSFMTGKNPGKHGAITFVRPKVDRRFGLIDSTKIEGEFYLLPEVEAKKKIVIGLPLTYPAKKLNGCMVSGPLTPSKESEGFVYPSSLHEEIASLLDRYMIDMDVSYLPGKQKEFLDNLEKVAEMRTQLIEHMLRHEEWDLAVVYYVVLDRVQHFFTGQDDNSWVFQAYSKVDSCLQRIMACVDDETNVLVFSDHGFGRIKGKFCPNAWLKENGFLFYRRKLRLPIGPQRLRLLVESPKARLLRRVIPDRLLRRANLFWQARDWSLGFASIDWSKTKAFATVSGIHICCEESTKDHQATKEEIIRGLKELKHPETGQELGVKVWAREELYSGSYLHRLPDIMFSVEDYAYEPAPTFEDLPYCLPHHVPRGWHREEAIFLACGPDIERGREIDAPAIYDIAPTVLHIMGAPIPSDMDGKVLIDIFREGSGPAQRDIVSQSAKGEREKMKRKLRRLKRSGRI